LQALHRELPRLRSNEGAATLTGQNTLFGKYLSSSSS
jgi:hypothetical protein